MLVLLSKAKTALPLLACLFGFLAATQAQPLPGAQTKEPPITADPNKTFDEYLEEVNGLAEVLLRDYEQDRRQQAHDTLFRTLHAALLKPEADTAKFSQLRGIAVQQDPKGKFSIFTWQLFVDDSTYQYGGLVRTKEGKIFPLTDKANEVRQPFHTRLRHDNWYGALYYKMIPFQHDGKDMYLLFGYNAHGFYTRRKLLDVLYFENDKPRFGYNVLQMKDSRGKVQNVQRFIMEYSASVTVSLNYSDLDKMIVFDHLIYGAPIEGGGATNVPDGSYCGLRLEKGKWVYVDKIHEDKPDPNTSWNNPTAPIPHPVLDGEAKKKNIFGRNKKGK